MVFGYIHSLLFGKTEKVDDGAIHEPRTIPIIISMDAEDTEAIVSCRKLELDDVVLDVIHRKNEMVYRVIKEYLCFNIMIPRSDASYKRRILSMVTAAEKLELRAIDIKHEQQKLRGYSVFVDMRENRLCVSIWNGSIKNNN